MQEQQAGSRQCIFVFNQTHRSCVHMVSVH